MENILRGKFFWGKKTVGKKSVGEIVPICSTWEEGIMGVVNGRRTV